VYGKKQEKFEMTALLMKKICWTFEMTALLMKKIHLLLHCYTIRYAEEGYPEAYWSYWSYWKAYHFGSGPLSVGHLTIAMEGHRIYGFRTGNWEIIMGTKCVAVCCSVLQRVAACCSVLGHYRRHTSVTTYLLGGK